LDPSTGVISGTPTTAGTSSFTARVADARGQDDIQALSITISPIPPPPNPPTITTTTLSAGTVNQPYSQGVQATGGTGALTWSLAAGSGPLPANLNLNPINGVISGTPTAAGTSLFTVQVQDSGGLSDTQALSITINAPTPPPAPSITTTTLPAGTITLHYSAPLMATGGTGGLTWSIVTGNLPTGLDLNQTTGVISGTPIVPGTSSFTVRVVDAAGQDDSQALSILITLTNPPQITTTTLPGGTVGQPYNQTLQATGGIGTLTWSLSGGSLTPMLSLSPAGVISGTPTNTGNKDFTVKVTDTLNQSDTQALSIVVSAGLTITSNNLPDAHVGKAYNQTLQRSGGVSPFTWSVTPALPDGLNLNASTGQITGAPANGTDQEGNGTFTFTVQDSSSQTASKSLKLQVKK
jgi:hypothetical protein